MVVEVEVPEKIAVEFIEETVEVEIEAVEIRAEATAMVVKIAVLNITIIIVLKRHRHGDRSQGAIKRSREIEIDKGNM
eukprot:gene2429-5369_t